MSFRKSVSYTALSLALAAGSAQADVTGPEVWADWKGYFESFGYSVSGTETQSGDTLTVADIVMSMDLPDDEGKISASMGSLGFTDAGNGAVNVILPATMPITFDVTSEVGEAVQGSIVLDQTAPVMVVSGAAGDLTYAYSAQSVRMRLGDMTIDGEAMPPEMFKMTMEMTDISNTTRTTVGDLRGYDSNMTARALTYDIAFDVPEGPDAGAGSFVGAMQGLTFTGDAAFAEGVDATDMVAMMEAGTSVTSTMTYDSGNSDINIVSPDGPIAGVTSSDGGSLGVSMTPEGLRYDVSQANLNVNMQSPEFPFPIALQMAKSAFVFGMPMVPSDDPQGFAFGFTMGDFTVSDAIWNLFDPAAQLPRDPATLSLDLTGTVKLLANLFDPEAMMASRGMPGEINSLDLNDLLISVAGAKITGAGGLVFDNTDTATFGGFPRPEGAVDMRVEGANKLMDTLVTMGLLPQEQAMGARMMMGMLGVPDGDDALTSKIEINAQGHILANGQRIQ